MAGGAGQQKRSAVSPEGALAGLVDAGVERAVGLVLAPHYSRASVGEYHARAGEAAEARAWATPASTAGTTSRRGSTPRPSGCRRRRPRSPSGPRSCSPPTRCPSGCWRATPTPTSCASAAAIAKRADLGDGWAGLAVGGPHARTVARPDILDLIRELGAGARWRACWCARRASCRTTWRVLYDLDVDARRVAGEMGLAFARTASINDEPAVLNWRERRAAGVVSEHVDLAVVGAGISGLAAAWEGPARKRVVVLEAGDRPEGKVRTSPLAGVDLDEAADAFLAKVPEAVDLCAELGLETELVSPATGTAAAMVGRRPAPAAPEQLLGVPVDMDAVAASGLLSPAGVERKRQDLTRPDDRPGGDESVGALVRRRLGDEVHERLVAPLVGGICAGDCDRLSLEVARPNWPRPTATAISPSLVRAAAALPGAGGGHGPAGVPGPLGWGRADDRRAGRRPRRRPADQLQVTAVTPTGAGVAVEPAGVVADSVVLAAPAFAAAPLLSPVAPEAGAFLAGIDTASVALNGPGRARRDRQRHGRVRVPGAHRRGPDHHRLLVGDQQVDASRRGPVPGAVAGVGGPGRRRPRLTLADSALVAAVLDLATTMGVKAPPSEVGSPFNPARSPSPPGRLCAVADAEAAVARVSPRLAVTGAWKQGRGHPRLHPGWSGRSRQVLSP